MEMPPTRNIHIRGTGGHEPSDAELNRALSLGARGTSCRKPRGSGQIGEGTFP